LAAIQALLAEKCLMRASISNWRKAARLLPRDELAGGDRPAR
jgi:hypothetical protein